MPKYLDLKVGKKLKVFRFKCGDGQSGKWGFFSYTPYEKNQDGSTTYGQEYSIVISNLANVQFAIKDGDSVEIERINSVTADFQSFTSKTNNQKINKTVIKVAVDIKTTNDFSGAYVPASEFENQSSTPQNNPYQDDNGVDYSFPVDDEDLNVPNF